MYYAMIPPELISGWLYAGPGSAPMLATAAAWDTLAAELHSAAASYGAVVGNLGTQWRGSAAASMAAAAAPYVTWMHTTATQAERAGVQAKAAAATFEAAHTGVVPPPTIAANRAQLAALVATNILGQNTPAIAATEAGYLEFWAQDAAVMYAYQAGSAAATRLTAFVQPPKTTNETGTVNQLQATGATAGKSVASNVQTTVSQVASTLPQTVQQTVQQMAESPMDAIKNFQTLSTPAIMVAQNGSYLFSLANSLNSLFKAGSSAASTLSAPAQALGSALSQGAGLSGIGSGVSASLGQAGAVGAMAVPQAWAGVARQAGSLAGGLPGSSGLGALSAAGTNPSGMLGGMPMLANAARAATSNSSMPPRFDLRPSVIPMSPAAG